MAGKADTEIHDRDTVTILTPDTLVFPSFSSGGVEVGGGGGQFEPSFHTPCEACM